MSPADPSPERLERMKKILADSYPRRGNGEKLEPLPASVLAELTADRGGTRSAPAGGESLFGRVVTLFRGPQLVGLAAAAVLVLAAIVVIQPFDRGGQAMRSGGGTVAGPALVILHDLTEAQVAAIRESGYFRPEQVVVVPAGQGIDAAVADHPQDNLIVVDGATGRISAPYAAGEAPDPVALPPRDTDLAPLILDFLARLPEGPSK